MYEPNNDIEYYNICLKNCSYFIFKKHSSYHVKVLGVLGESEILNLHSYLFQVLCLSIIFS